MYITQFYAHSIRNMFSVIIYCINIVVCSCCFVPPLRIAWFLVMLFFKEPDRNHHYGWCNAMSSVIDTGSNKPSNMYYVLFKNFRFSIYPKEFLSGFPKRKSSDEKLKIYALSMESHQTSSITLRSNG